MIRKREPKLAKPASRTTRLLAVVALRDRKAARGGNAPAERVTAAQDFQRKAQFYLDFIEAENSSGFHAPQEALRVLGESINFARKGQLELRPVPVAGGEIDKRSVNN